MHSFSYTPPLPTKPTSGPFTQKIVLTDGEDQLGRATWHSTEDAAGVTQILELWIDPAHRRSGLGRRLLLALIEQARAYHRQHQRSLRRLWSGVGHKQQVIGRSFLTREGFHHIGSACGILHDQDMLIYVKSLD
jgi:GNAT superfamily N-acetyltransferase